MPWGDLLGTDFHAANELAAWTGGLGTATTTATTGSTYYWLGADNTATATTTSSTTQVYIRQMMVARGTNTVWWSNIDDTEAWVDQTQYVTLSRSRVLASQQRTTAEMARHEEQRRIAQQQLELREEAYRVAMVRSRRLLLSHLTAAQRDTFEKNHWFVVEGGQSRQLYRIRNSGSYSANIDVLEGLPGKVTHRLCCHLRDGSIPLFDHLLAQKVWIERDEDQFLRTANRHAA